LPVLLRFTDYDYPFGIFKLFLQTPVPSKGHYGFHSFPVV
jgi:hypothetical protein